MCKRPTHVTMYYRSLLHTTKTVKLIEHDIIMQTFVVSITSLWYLQFIIQSLSHLKPLYDTFKTHLNI